VSRLEVGDSECRRQVMQKDAFPLAPGIRDGTEEFERLPLSRRSIRRIAAANSVPIQVWGMSPVYSGDRDSLQTTSAHCRQPLGLRQASAAESSRKASSAQRREGVEVTHRVGV
jgi:hypothetical protein